MAKGIGKPPAFQFYPGDWLSSPDVILMSPAERGAYITLLATSWQSDPTAYLPNDEDRIRRITQLTPKQWSESRSLLLKKFPSTEDGTLRYNPRLAQVAAKQEAYRKQMQANSLNVDGKPGGRPRKDNPKVPEENPKVIEDKPEANPNETTLSLSLSSSLSLDSKAKVQELVLSPSEKRTKPPAKRTPDPRHIPFREVFEAYFRRKNPDVGVPSPGGAEAGQLSIFLEQQPDFTLEQWQRVIANRERSLVTHAHPLSRWIKHALAFYAGPADNYGNTIQNKGVAAHGSITRNVSTAEQQVIDAGQSLLDARERARCTPAQHDFRGSTLEAGHTSAQSTGVEHYPRAAY